MWRLDNPVRRYAWGSVDAIPRLVGVPPDGRPQAELWLGAHERAASRVLAPDGPLCLRDVVSRDPLGELGPAWAARRRMPFLAKLLATAEPLSLQVHPPPARAALGYAAEEAAGVAQDARTRSFPDDVAKAEMVWALAEFRALCGFRAADEAVGWLRSLEVPALEPTAQALSERGPAALRAEAERLLRQPAPAEAVAAVRAHAAVLAGPGPWAQSARAAVELADRYPDDPAVLLALLLQPHVLARGEAMFVRPGQPHTYLSGTAFEVQANSDNVARAGLTDKHVDGGLWLEALETSAGPDAGATVVGHRLGDELVLAPPTPWFALAVLYDATGAALPGVPGPQVFFCVDGDFVLDAGAGRGLRLAAGQSAYASAGTENLRVRGTGTLLRVTTGRAGCGHPAADQVDGERR